MRRRYDEGGAVPSPLSSPRHGSVPPLLERPNNRGGGGGDPALTTKAAAAPPKPALTSSEMLGQFSWGLDYRTAAEVPKRGALPAAQITSQIVNEERVENLKAQIAVGAVQALDPGLKRVRFQTLDCEKDHSAFNLKAPGFQTLMGEKDTQCFQLEPLFV